MDYTASLLLDGMGILLMVILLISARHTARSAAYDQRVYHELLQYTLLMNLMDFTACIMRPTTDFLTQIVLFVLGMLLHALQIVVSWKWCVYVDYRTHQSRKRLRGRYGILLAMPMMIAMVLLVVNCFTRSFFFIQPDTGAYQWQPPVLILFMIAFGYAIYSAVLPLLQRKSWRYYLTFPVAAFLGPVLIGNVVHLALGSVSVSWAAMALGFASVQLSAQNDLSFIDPLTGLYNRHFLNQHLHAMFERMDAAESSHQMGGILIDLDRFKEINDIYGHVCGDQALQEIGAILRETLPLDAVACRFGGDEFVVVAPVDSREEIGQLVELIRQHVAQRNERHERPYELLMSIGWTVYARQADTMDSFLGRMDEKMYRDKEAHHRLYAETRRTSRQQPLI